MSAKLTCVIVPLQDTLWARESGWQHELGGVLPVLRAHAPRGLSVRKLKKAIP